MKVTALPVAGAILLILGILFILSGVLEALHRIRRQYSPAMEGTRGLYINGALAGIGRRWPGIILVAAGIALLVLFH